MSTEEVLKELNEVVNNLNENNIENSDGISDWMFWAIIISVVVIVVIGTVFLVRYILNKRRESNEIIADVAHVISSDVDKKIANTFVDSAIRTEGQRAQIEANTQTAVKLYTAGNATVDDVAKAVLVAEASKLKVEQENLKASQAIQDLRKKELDQADAQISVATKNAEKAANEYDKLSNEITSQNLKKAQDVLNELIAKRAAADVEYQKAISTRVAAEAAAKKRLEESASAKQSIVKAAQDRLKAIADLVNQARYGVKAYNAQKKQDAAAKKQPKPALPQPAPQPAPGPSPQPASGPAPGSVMLMSETATSYLDNTTIASGKKAWGKTFPVPPQFKNALKLTFEINFAPGFSFDDGPTDARGKVGGIFIGEGAASGCSHSEAASLRLMWDHGRTAQAYTYIPTSSRGKQPDFVNKIGNPECGLHIWRDDFRGIFKNTGTWNTVTLGVYLNTVGKNDGKIYMSIVTNERTLTKESGGFIWRNKDWPITSISFNSFFGGDTQMKKVKPSTFQIRNIRAEPY